jgi:hypothetical protein
MMERPDYCCVYGGNRLASERQRRLILGLAGSERRNRLIDALAFAGFSSAVVRTKGLASTAAGLVCSLAFSARPAISALVSGLVWHSANSRNWRHLTLFSPSFGRRPTSSHRLNVLTVSRGLTPVMPRLAKARITILSIESASTDLLPLAVGLLPLPASMSPAILVMSCSSDLASKVGLAIVASPSVCRLPSPSLRENSQEFVLSKGWLEGPGGWGGPAGGLLLKQTAIEAMMMISIHRA